ncbi:MAG: TRAP transporter TatT component family protein [Bacteroidota bacterium]
MAIQSLTDVFENGFEALNEESDLILAEQAIGSNLKTIEGVIRSDPENTRLLFLLARGYTGYALGFVEDVDLHRAREMYRRGRDYGLRILRRKKAFRESLDGSFDDFQRALQTLEDEDTPAVFWAAMGWGSFINLSRDDPDALAQMPKVVAMMRFVLSRNENFYYGGVHLFFGVWFGSRPTLLGGDPDSSKYHFEQSIAIGEGKFLLPYVYYARYYAVQTQDRGLFEELLEKVVATSSDVMPEERLANTISKRKAKMYLEEIDAYF